MTKSLLPLLLALLLFPAPGSAQSREGVRRAAALGYLNDLHADVKRSYYDKTFRGHDIEAAYDSARARLDRAESDQERYHAIDLYLEPLNDSHTRFYAPRRIHVSDFGFGFRFYGNAAFVVGIDPSTSADSAGLRLGDQIERFDGKPITRENADQVLREFFASHPIRPLPLVVRAPNQSVSELMLTADTAAIYRIKGAAFRRLLSSYQDSLERATSHVQASIADSVFFWKLPQFTHEDKGLDDVMKRVVKHPVLVLDLRGNGGGSIKTLTTLTAHFVKRELVVGEVHARFRTETFVAKPKKQVFEGRMFILIDSETASAAEIFSRLMQLEGTATVVGDRSAGAVMASNFRRYDDWAGASITISDFVLHNGERLESVGVTPDVHIVPTGAHIAQRADVTLAYALQRAGLPFSPLAAQRLLNASAQ